MNEFTPGIGQPDWSQQASTQIVTGIQDMGELAARLKSPVVFVRTGNVILIDDFSYGLQAWSVTLGGALATALAIHTDSLYGYAHAEIAGDGADNDNNLISRTIGLPETGKIGVEVSLKMEAIPEALQLNLTYDGESTNLQYRLAFANGSSNITVRNSVPANQTVLTKAGLNRFLDDWGVIKLVVDIENGTYDKLFILGQIIDLSSISPPSGAGLGSNALTIEINSLNRAGQADMVMLDGVIVTINEP